MGWGGRGWGEDLDLAWHSMNKTIQMMLMKLLGIKQQTGFFFLPSQVARRSAPPSSSPALRYNETFAHVSRVSPPQGASSPPVSSQPQSSELDLKGLVQLA